MRWSPLWTVPHAGVRSVQCSFLNQYMTGKMFLETSSLISGLCWFLIYLYFWSSSGLSLKEKFGQPKTLRSVPIPTAWGKLRQLNSCPKAMFLKVSSQDPKISTWAQWLFWQEGQQEGFCTASHLSPRKDILPLKDNSQRPFWDAPVSPGVVDVGDSPEGWGSPASFWEPCRYGNCVQLYDLVVVHLSQSETLLELLFSVILIQIH